MKNVTSEDNLAGYYLSRPSFQSPTPIDSHKINQKIKTLKTALKMAERHNEDLHQKIKVLKENNQLEILRLDNQYRKYRQLYQTLAENYEMRGMELKDCRKRLKKVQIQHAHSVGNQMYLEEAQQTGRQYRETIVKQQKQVAKHKEETRVLYQQLYQKSTRIKQLEQMFTKSSSKGQQKDRMFLLNLRNALENKNQEFQKLIQEKTQLSLSKIAQQKQNSELHVRIARVNAELQMEKKANIQVKSKVERLQRQQNRIGDELRSMTNKYNQLLTFSYQVQRDFEKELHGINKELTRRETIRQ